jgi:hypothetical protein
VRRQLVAIVSSTLLLLSWFACDGTAASILDSLLNPLRDYLVRAAARYLSEVINGTIEVDALRGSLFSAPVLQHVVLRDAEGTVVGRIKEIRMSYELASFWTLNRRTWGTLRYALPTSISWPSSNASRCDNSTSTPQ